MRKNDSTVAYKSINLGKDVLEYVSYETKDEQKKFWNISGVCMK